MLCYSACPPCSWRVGEGLESQPSDHRPVFLGPAPTLRGHTWRRISHPVVSLNSREVGMLLMSKKDAPVAQLIPKVLGAWCQELNGGRNRFKLLLCL